MSYFTTRSNFSLPTSGATSGLRLELISLFGVAVSLGYHSVGLSSEDGERIRSHIRAVLSRLREPRNFAPSVDRPEAPRPSDQGLGEKGDEKDKSALLVHDLDLAVG
jgi:hypothetical protein